MTDDGCTFLDNGCRIDVATSSSSGNNGFVDAIAGIGDPVGRGVETPGVGRVGHVVVVQQLLGVVEHLWTAQMETQKSQ